MTGVQVARFSWELEGSQPAVVTHKRIPALKPQTSM